MIQNPSSSQQSSLNGLSSSVPQKQDALLVEIAWEVANQVGGIYTVIRSKVPSMIKNWGDRYCLVGPYVHPSVSAIFEPMEPEDGPYGRAVVKMRELGFEVHYGRWLTSGSPRVVLFNPFTVYDRLGDIKYLLWEHHGISTPGGDDLLNQVVAFGWMVKMFMTQMCQPDVNTQPLICHVHEWMAGTVIPEIRRDQLPVHTVFTTHATLLGRYLAMNDPEFYEHLPTYDWLKEAIHFNIETSIRIERAAAHGAHIFTTVSELTARECEYLIGRKPEALLPNGLNISRLAINHEIQNTHQKFKDEIHRFTMGHFFSNQHFELDKTMYFFTSGRYEYKNKGYDLTLEALARLNWRMKEANIDKTVVMFFITKREFQSINPEVMQSQTSLDKMINTIRKIQDQIGTRIFYNMLSKREQGFPDLREFIDDDLKIKFRRNIQTWQTTKLPPVVTHNMVDDANDDILNFLRRSNLLNYADDKVKIVYHPDFVSAASPLWGIEYDEFVSGCHLGIFPSYYEPWGYTPLECMANGVAAVTSDLAGFGDYLVDELENPESCSLYVVNRKNRSFDEAANQLADFLFSFVHESRTKRIQQRYKLLDASMLFDWSNLTRHYEAAYDKVLSQG